MDENIKRLLAWAKGNPQGPLSIHIDPTNKCNLKCKFCWQRSHERLGWIKYDEELSDQKLKSLVKEAADLGVREWLISGGGEPLVRKEATLDMMRMIKQHGMHGDIITNGTLFNENDIKELVELGWDRVRFSMNGPDAKVHDFVVSKKGAFDKAIAAMKLFAKWKKKLKKKLPELGFNTVINSQDYMHFPEMMKLVHDLDGCLMNVQSVILFDEAEKKWALDENQRKEFQGIIKESLKLAKKYKIHTNLDAYLDQDLVEKSNIQSGMKPLMESNEKGIENASCYEPWLLVTIRPFGIAGSCRLFRDDGVKIHDKTLKEVWFGEYFGNARKRLEEHDVPDYCAECSSNEFIENKKIKEALQKCMKRK